MPDPTLEVTFTSRDESENPRQPEILICPAQKGPWGVVTETSGPQESPASGNPSLIRAEALLRVGMVALDKSRPSRLDDAELHFRKALRILEEVLPSPHPRISYALDRIGLVWRCSTGPRGGAPGAGAGDAEAGGGVGSRGGHTHRVA